MKLLEEDQQCDSRSVNVRFNESNELDLERPCMWQSEVREDGEYGGSRPSTTTAMYWTRSAFAFGQSEVPEDDERGRFRHSPTTPFNITIKGHVFVKLPKEDQKGESRTRTACAM